MPSRLSSRCFYVSFLQDEIELPWHSALTRCSEIDPDSSLISIRNENEQFEIQGTLSLAIAVITTAEVKEVVVVFC